MENIPSRTTPLYPGQPQDPAHTSVSPRTFSQLQFVLSCAPAAGLYLLGNKSYAFLASVVLAQAKTQPKVGIKVKDFEVNQTQIQVPALSPDDGAALATFLTLPLFLSQFPEHSL